MLKNKLLKETAIYAIGEIVPKLIGFFLLPIYTNYLSPADYGILSYTNSIVMFLFILGTLSMNTFVLRFYYEQKTETDKKRIIGNVFVFISLVNLIIFVTAFMLAPSLISKYNIQVPWKPYFQLALINNLLEGFSIIPLVLFRVKQRAKFFVTLSVSRIVLQFALTFLFIVNLKMGLIGHYYGRLFSLCIFFIIYWFIIYKEATLNINISQIKKALKFSLPLLPGAIAYLALSISDRIILERHVAISEIGIYNIAYILAFALSMVVQSGYRAIEPEFFKRYGSENYFEFVRKIQSIFLFVVYLMAMILTLFSQEVFKVLASTDYYKGYLLVPVIIIGAIMTGQNVIFSTVLTADKKTKIVGFSSFIGAIISVAFNLLLVPIWGVYAAAISAAFAYTAMNIFLFIKMNLPGKSLKSEWMALGCFIAIVFSVFYIFKIELSMTSFVIKTALLLFYLALLAKIFKIDLRKIKNEIQFKNNNQIRI